MPTGITSGVYDGTETTMRQYLLRVSRSMAYAMRQRDSDPSEHVKRVEPETSYFDESLKRGRDRIEWLSALSVAEVADQAAQAYEKAYAGWRERRDEKHQLQLRYETMIAEVEAWQPDPLIQSTKELALSQLHESVKFDCAWSDAPPVRREPSEWLVAEQEAAKRSIKYAKDEIAKAIKRAEETNRYIDAFYASLPVEVSS